MTLQDLHDMAWDMLQRVPPDTEVAITSDASDWLESLNGTLKVVQTQQGNEFVVLDQGDAYGNTTCFARAIAPGVYTEDQAQF